MSKMLLLKNGGNNGMGVFKFKLRFNSLLLSLCLSDIDMAMDMAKGELFMTVIGVEDDGKLVRDEEAEIVLLVEVLANFVD